MKGAGGPARPVRADRRMRDLVEGLDAIFWEADPETWQVTFVSRRAEEILGYPIEQWLTDPNFWVNILHPEDREQAVAACLASVQEGHDHELEYRVIAADGRVVWLHELSHVARDAEGRAQQMRGLMVDVTAQKQAEKALRARARQQEAVADLGQRALAGASPAALMDAAVALVAHTLDVEYAKVLELLPDGRALRFRAGVGWEAGVVGSVTVGAGRDSQAGYTLLTRAPVVVDDWRTERRFSLPTVHRDLGLTSGVTVIIDGPGAPFGVLGAHTARQRTFTRDDILFLQAVANVLAMAIQRRRVEEERERLLAELEAERTRLEAVLRQQQRTADAQRFLAEASRQLAASLDYQATLEAVARLAVPELGDWCLVDFREADGSVRLVAATHADPAQLALMHELRRRYPLPPAADHPVANVLRTGQPELRTAIDDPACLTVSGDPEERELLRRLGIRSCMSVPLVTAGRAFGAITFATAESGRAYGLPDLALADDLARRAALAVDNGRLYREAQEAARQAQEAACAATDAVRARDAFLARASHELRTPLTSAVGTVRLLKRALAGAFREPPESLVDIASRNLDAMLALINDLLDASKLAAGQEPLALEPLALQEVVNRSLEVIGPQARDKGVLLRVILPAGPRVLADPLKLEQVLVNLLANAVKFTSAGGEVTVEAAADQAHVVVRVRDTGEGIQCEHLERIFEPFFQATPRTERRPRGTGLGLAICRQIVTLHNGTIWAESEGPGRGSTFTVRLPAASVSSRAA